MKKETLFEDYTTKNIVNGSSIELYWLDNRGKPHRKDDQPAIITVTGSWDIIDMTWMRHGVESRALGRPSYVNMVTGEERYKHKGRPYDLSLFFKSFYDLYNSTTKSIKPDDDPFFVELYNAYGPSLSKDDRKLVYDILIDKYFLGKAIRKEQVVEYAKSRLSQINTEQACHSMVYVNEGKVIQETTSKKPDTVIRFNEGPVAPLNNNTIPRKVPGKVHNYVMVFVPRKNHSIPESDIEFLAMNLVELRSKHAHILLSKFAPKYEDFKYLISGESIVDPQTGELSINIQSGMNWQLNLSRFTQEDIQGLRNSITKDIREGSILLPPDLEDYAYIMMHDILRGQGPKADMFGALPVIYFTHVLGYKFGSYSTASFRGLTKETVDNMKSWCNEGVTIEKFSDLKTCKIPTNKGEDVCLETGAEKTKTRKREPESPQIDFSKITIAQLKEILDERGIEYPSRPRRNQLIELVMESS